MNSRKISGLALLLVLGAGPWGLIACGRNEATRPAAPARVTLRLTAAPGPQGTQVADTLVVSAYAASVRLAGPITVVAAGGQFNVAFDVPAGEQRVIGVGVLRNPGPNDPEDALHGMRLLGRSAPFMLVAGDTASVAIAFTRYVPEPFDAAAAGTFGVRANWRSVAGAARYRLARFSQGESAAIVADTLVTDSLVTWAGGRQGGGAGSYRVRAEGPYGVGAWSNALLVDQARGITGRIVAGGQPVSNVLVKLLACDGDDTGFEAFTGAQGNFEFTGVAPGSYRLRIFRGGCVEQFDPPLDAACLEYGGGVVQRPDVELACTPVWALFTLTWGTNPRDLDAYLYTPVIPDTGGTSQAWEVFYGRHGAVDEPPFVELDTDATGGFGPENITIHRNFPGDYLFMVHQFSGDSTLVGSGATVRIVPPAGAAPQTVTVSAGGDPSKRWWIVARIDGSTGVVTMIDTLATIPPVRSTSGRLKPTASFEPDAFKPNAFEPKRGGDGDSE